MNIYGDWGNVLTLLKRLEWHGYDPQLLEHHPGEPFPHDVDLVIGGGGQDSGQGIVQVDLQKIAQELRALADDDTPMLMICGLYQLFGHRFVTHQNESIPGIGIFDLETIAGNNRMIGNVISSSPHGKLIGYENHSGATWLGKNQKPLGKVLKGDGNNGQDSTEGAIYRSVFGSYLHGSLLPKNPQFADELIRLATIRKFGSFEPRVIDDTFSDKARAQSMKRPR